MSNWATKTTKCQKCDADFEWLTQASKYCLPCRKAIKRSKDKKRYSMKRGGNVRSISPKTYDLLPKQDWVMERQFKFFYDMIGLRYNTIKDVSRVIEGNHYRQKMK